jgi:ankyrin repeat protein
MEGKIKTNPYLIAAAILNVVTASISAQATDFMEPVKTGSPKDVGIAIDNGLDVNARDAENGWTALICAASFNDNPEVIIALLKAGTNAK